MKIVQYSTLCKLACGECPGEVIICLSTELATTGFIEGTVKCYNQECKVFIYSIEYDEEQLIDPTTGLEFSDIEGVLCRDCFTRWIETLISEPLFAEDTSSINTTVTEDIPQVISSVVIVSEDEGNTIELRADGIYSNNSIGAASGFEALDVSVEVAIASDIVPTFVNTLSISLPAAGRYLINANLQYLATSDAGAVTDILSYARLYDSTAAAVIANTLTLLQSQEKNYEQHPTYGGVYNKSQIVTVEEASVIYLQHAGTMVGADGEGSLVAVGLDDEGSTSLEYLSI